MNCRFCDATVAVESNFCSRCGNRIGDVTSHQSNNLSGVKSNREGASGSNFSIASMFRKGLATRVALSTIAYGLLGLWAGSVIPIVDATTLGALGAAYGALRKL